MCAKASDLVRVLLIGDSIRKGYGKTLRPLIEGELRLGEASVQDTAYCLRFLRVWLAGSDFRTHALIQFNCGLHDIGRPMGGPCRREIPAYVDNLRRIIDLLRDRTSATLA